MKISLLLLVLFTTTCFADTKLFLFGGGSRPAAALEAYTSLSGGINSSILIIPWASEDNEGAENIKRDISKFPVGKITISSANITEFKKQIDQVTGIFFTGGDQVELMRVMTELKAKPLFKELYARGVVFAGTSAGTAIMSERMLTGEGDFDVLDGTRVELTEGLGLLPRSIIVDQHFIARSRYNRLGGLVLNLQAFGIGVDEGNALFIDNNKEATAFGRTHVLLFSPMGPKRFIIDVLDHKQKIDLTKYQAFNIP